MTGILVRMFGHPEGILGRLGGLIMARTNRECAAWVVGLLDVGPNESVLEVGFGPGVGIELLAQRAVAGYVAGIDPSIEMVAQATARNAEAIKRGQVDLRRGSVASLPFADAAFDKTVAINSMQLWPDAVAGLREIARVVRGGGRVALGFTPYSGQPKRGVDEALAAAGFTTPRMVEQNENFCGLATRS
jgi:ubiquinone/menaquinone biosynthesis C-methylase UbiE